MDYTGGPPLEVPLTSRKRSRPRKTERSSLPTDDARGDSPKPPATAASPDSNGAVRPGSGEVPDSEAGAGAPPLDVPTIPKATKKGEPKEPAAPGRGPASLAPPVKESFEQLARTVASAEPHRGSIMQPPPAWRPDEVTLGFAMATDTAGKVQELPEPTLLATILMAVEVDRRRLLNLLAGGGDEEIEAVANLFWPLIVLPGRKQSEVAIFDGTGVWRRAFRYTLPPSLEHVTKLLEADFAPKGFLDRVRALIPEFAHDPGAEVLTVEGFLPVDPPLLFDVLSHTEFRSDPQSPHAGFLPARHDVRWYEDTVAEMYRWLDRFDSDLRTLGEVRERIRGTLEQMNQSLQAEYDRLQAEARQRVSEAIARSEAETAELHKRHREQILRHMVALRQAHATAAHGEAAATTADTLAFRASHRRTEGGPHAARRRDAEAAVHRAHREAAEARRSIEQVHAQERADLEQALVKVTEVERESARSLAENELFRDEFTAAGNDLLQAIDGQIAARSAQKNLLTGYFLPVGNLAGVRVVWFPLWVATLKGSRGLRQLVFPPMKVRTEKRLAGVLKQFFGGLVLPVEPRTAQFDKVLRTTMEDALRKDTWLSTATRELTRASDVLVDPDVLHRLEEGLRDLVRDGWVTKKQQQNFLVAYLERSRRQGHAAGGPEPVTVGEPTEPSQLGPTVDGSPTAPR
jgi:hypothetical protein